MIYYRAIFKIPGGKELQSKKGYVPDAFFKAIQNVRIQDIVVTYNDGFILSNEMHNTLNIPDTYTTYAVVGDIVNDIDINPEFKFKLLLKLKAANHARPLEEHIHYQVFYMEYIEPIPDDD